MSRDEYISQVAQDIQNKLPAVFKLDVLRKRLGLDVSPTSVVLLQELERFNKLLVRMGLSLAELQRVSLVQRLSLVQRVSLVQRLSLVQEQQGVSLVQRLSQVQKQKGVSLSGVTNASD